MKTRGTVPFISTPESRLSHSAAQPPSVGGAASGSSGAINRGVTWHAPDVWASEGASWRL